MTTYLNYIIEANIGLVLFLGFYQLLLKRETHFRMQRASILTGILASLTFPLFHLEPLQTQATLSIGQAMPSTWLPEMVVAGGEAEPALTAPVFWPYLTLLYGIGLVIFALAVLLQLGQIIQLIRKSHTYRLLDLRIAESGEDKPTFSFFNFVFIGRAHTLSLEEKQQIIRHERVHARRLHSVDILLINMLKIFFWFNPLLRHYEKTFVQLHEFEADAGAVENSDTDQYCSLLAKEALASADFKLANHFNSSLTLKRITMIRAVKNKVSHWKLALCALVLPAAFLLISCQDQLRENQYVERAQTISEIETSQDQTISGIDEPATPPEDFYNIVRKNLRYPATSRANHKYGSVLVQFVVNENGSVSDAKVLDSPDEALAEEALRIVNMSPKWTSARVAGEPIKQKMVLPIVFKLDIPGMENNPSTQSEKIIETEGTPLEKIVVVGYASK